METLQETIDRLTRELEDTRNKAEMFRRNYEHELQRDKCCGFKNYETSTVTQLLESNSKELNEKLYKRGKEILQEYPEPAREGEWSQAAVVFGEEIENWTEDNIPKLIGKVEKDLNLYSSLINAALDRVDWREVANYFLTE